MKVQTTLSGFFLLVLLKIGRGEVSQNDPCSTEPGHTNSCEFEKGLVCANANGSSVCRCVDESQMEYNLDKGSCLVFVNGKRNWTNPIKADHHISLPCKDPHTYGWDDSHCECVHDFSPEVEGTISEDNRCLPSSSYEICDKSTLPCHPRSGMDCFKGHCHCPHPLKQNEVGQVWQKCMSIPEIVDGCRNSSECVPNSECGEDNKCHCNPGFVIGAYLDHQDAGIGCFVDHGGKCDDDYHGDLQCNQAAYLICLEGKCACLDEPDLVYDPTLHQCNSPEGHACTLKVESDDHLTIHCNSGLECQALLPGTENLNIGKCVKK